MKNAEFETQLQKLAELSVRFGVNIQPGQDLLITAPTGAVELVRLLAQEAYKAGGCTVLPFFTDDAMELARFEHAQDACFDHAPEWLFKAMGDALKSGKTARLSIAGETPGLLAGQDASKVARAAQAHSKARRPVLEAIISNSTNWNIIPFVTEGWAKMVFPTDDADTAQAKLWELIFRATRVDQPDPVAAWEENFAELYRRRDALQAQNFSALHFTGGGTDLTVGLAEGHKWVGGGLSLKNGVKYAPNLPTEEVFTMPDRNRTEGRAVFTKPVSVSGTIVEGLVVEFEGGRATKISADRGEDVIREHFTTDEGASHLGEVALVASSSPIAQSGVLFFNTLFDENAACHIAFGNSYDMNLLEGVDTQKAGANVSQIHTDCMIGSAETDVDGIGHDGARTPVLRAGEFVI